MNTTKMMEIIKRRRGEANDKQIGIDAVGDKEEAQVWWRIMTEYDNLIAEVESSCDDMPEITQGRLTRE